MKNFRIILITLLSLKAIMTLKIIRGDLQRERLLSQSQYLYHSEADGFKVPKLNSKVESEINSLNFPVERKLLSDNDKNQLQNKRFQEEYIAQVKKYQENYSFLNHLNDIENDDLKAINQRYITLKSQIKHTKDLINERFDEVFNNFIQPARSDY